MSWNILLFFYITFKNVKSMLSWRAIQMQVLSWVCPMSYCLPIPVSGVSGGNNGGSESAEGSGDD